MGPSPLSLFHLEMRISVRSNIGWEIVMRLHRSRDDRNIVDEESKKTYRILTKNSERGECMPLCLGEGAWGSE